MANANYSLNFAKEKGGDEKNGPANGITANIPQIPTRPIRQLFEWLNQIHKRQQGGGGSS
jgi:hypothetical protein